MPGSGQFTQGQTQCTGNVGAALQVAVELGDAQGTAGAMAAAVLLVQTAEGTVGVIDRSGADGVEAHAQGEESSIAVQEATRGVENSGVGAVMGADRSLVLLSALFRSSPATSTAFLVLSFFL
jgi:hypothetical protein